MTTSPVEPLTRRGVPLDPTLRTMALGQFANRFAGGALMTTSALYFTRHQGFSATEVGLALSVSALVGLLVNVPAGQLADTRGPTRVLSWLMLGAALTAWPPAFAPTPLALTLLLSVQAVFLSASGAVYQGVIAQLATGGRASVQGLPARRHQHRHRPGLDGRRPRAARRRGLGLHLGLLRTGGAHRLRRLEHDPPPRSRRTRAARARRASACCATARTPC